MRILLVLFLAGCAGPAPTGYYSNDGTGAIVWTAYKQPACSDVSISARVGLKHSLSCQVR